MKMRSAQRLALFIESDQISKLRKLSEKTGAPVSELIRRAIDAYLKQRSKEIA
jgi:predicted DNA-binding protein